MATMSKGRLEAFSDGVLAIIITIMVLELKVPRGADLAALRPMLPLLLSYVMSFVYVGIYWNNHHHLLHAARGVDAAVMWSNLHLLFWLSLVPVGTAWLGEHPDPWPTALYAFILLMCAVAYTVLQAAILRLEGPDSPMRRAVGRDRKGRASLGCYVAAIALAFVRCELAWALFVVVALVWLVPDRRMEAAQNPR